MARIASLRGLGTLILVLILAAAVYAFAAANTVPESGAGDGSGTISGYTISNIHYALNATTPTNIDSVSFTITPAGGASAPATVYVQLNGAGSWHSCTLGSGTWTCALTGQTAQAASALRVVAAQ